ncbi:MAG: family N-acetyltransferase [Chitinophagaceae bacterium]|nr:family N-acetyltransferase [Chitinophagaceae bacterium]
MVTPEINIRRALPEDADLVSHLSTITFEDTFRGTCTDDDLQSFVDYAFTAGGILNELKDEDDLYFIAYCNNIAAGYMRLKEDYKDYPAIKKYKALELKRIYVLKEYQSKKIGAALMAYALQVAEQKNYEVLWLGVWEHNEKAKSFYKKWGFTDTGDTHPFPIGNTPQTDHWMIKFIEKR